MIPDDLPSLVISVLRKNLLVSSLILLGIISLSIGMIQLLLSPKNDITFEKGSTESTSSSSAILENILVDVSGAVISPGVYKFKNDARVQDALSAAGGLGVDADRDYVARAMNLALPLKDGMKIYIPKIGSQPSSLQTNTPDIKGVATNSLQISLNSASSDELDTLPGIGKVTAQKIIDGRPYSSIEELSTRKIVSPKVFSQIKDRVGL